MTFCPDCEREIEGDFIAHREQEHPPSPIVVSGAGGIESQEAHGYQTPED
jgi:hypothetical protein